MMAELIYSKFSNERDRRFAIRTDIYEENGERFVKKAAVYQEGLSHVNNLERWYQELGELYEKYPFSCNVCTLEKDGARFEYVTGITLEELLDFMLSDGNVEEAKKRLSEYLIDVKRALSQKNFVMTEEFAKVFGNVQLPEGFFCAPVTNIDMVCGNLVLAETPVVLDYEWTFDFPIPVEFVLYRIIHYYEKTHRPDEVQSFLSLYEEFGITEELKNVFSVMEKNFQAYIKGSHIPTREMFGAMTPGLKGAQKDGDGKLQIYFSLGQGYCEEDSIKLAIKESLAQHIIDIPKGCTDLRIDPGDLACAVKVRKLAFDGSIGDLKTAAIAEGGVFGEWIYIAKFDPNISGIRVPADAGKLELDLEIYPENEIVLNHTIQKMNEMSVQVQKLEALKNTVFGKIYRKCRNLIKRK